MSIADYLEPAVKDFADQATATYSAPIDTSTFTDRQFVAGEDPLQTQAIGIAQQGVGSYQPFLTAAQAAQTQAAGTVGGLGGLTGASAYQPFMSPYQTQVIDTTLAEYDKQSQAGAQNIRDAAVSSGNFGGGREGAMLGQYQSDVLGDRAALQAQLLSQGFGQAQASRQADLQNQMALAQGQLGLGQAQLGLGAAQAGQAGQQAGMAGQRGALAQQQAGLAQSQLGLGQYQTGLAGALQGFQGTDIARAGQVGAADQAQSQAVLDAQREANRMAAYEPLERLGIYGQGVTGLMGGYPAQYQFTQQPNASPLASALGIGSTLGGIYGNIMGK